MTGLRHLLLLLFLWPGLAFASTPQPIMGGLSGNLPTTGSDVFPFGAFGTASTSTDNGQPVVAAAGTISNLFIKITVAPGSAVSRAFTINKNGVATSVTCSVTGTGSGAGITTCNDTSDSFSVVPGDALSLGQAATGTVAAASVQYGAEFVPTSDNNLILLASANTTNTTTQAYAAPTAASTVWNTTETSRQQLFPDAGTLSRFYANGNAGPGVSGSFALGFDNGGILGPTCTITGTGTGAGVNTCNDTSTSISVSANSLVDITETPVLTPSNVPRLGFGIQFVPSTSGNFPFMGSTQGLADGASNVFIPLSGDRNNSSEVSTSEPAPFSFTMTKITVSTTAPGGVATRTFSLRDSGVTTSLACTITGAATTCTTTGSVSITAGDTLSVEDSPAGSPATGNPLIGLIGTSGASAVVIHDLGLLGVGR